MPITEPLNEELTDAVYRAALEPAAWPEVMRLMHARFPSSAQTFYFLDLEPRRVRPICLLGVGPRWVQSFDELYFAADNPWIRLSERLHRPGVVRTNERLEALIRDHGALYRSAYYNEWMRPQGFKYTIGNTLLAGDGVVANITLLRPADMPTFDDAEVHAFDVLSRHLTRALQMGVRLERAEQAATGTAAFDALPQAIALLDARRRLVYANVAMEAVLKAATGLIVRQGVLGAIDAGAERDLIACTAAALAPAGAGVLATAPVLVPLPGGTHLSLHAMPIVGAIGHYLPATPLVLLTAATHSGKAAVSADAIRHRWGCTRSEARLTQLLAEGQGLREAAAAMGVTYGSARVYLKLAFEKVGVHSQAQLVARVLAETAGPG
jgi:DNA-binding CsgD family transcriptional regulator/PAS domain-containing protein